MFTFRWDINCSYILEILDLKKQIKELNKKCERFQNENEKLTSEIKLQDTSLREIFTAGQLTKLKRPNMLGQNLIDIN